MIITVLQEEHRRPRQLEEWLVLMTLTSGYDSRHKPTYRTLYRHSLLLEEMLSEQIRRLEEEVVEVL